MATQRSLSRFSTLKKSRKFRDRARRESRRMHLEHLEDRRVMATGPALAALIPNGGVFLNNNDTLRVAPRELTFRFAEGQIIDAGSILNSAPLVSDNGIRLFRAGVNGTLGDLDDIEITPGFMGLADSPREVIMRFAANLPDDLYRIQIVGAGLTPLKDSVGLPFNGGVDQIIDFNLDLGTKVLAVVPQPITRNPTTGALSQNLRTIEVYFDQNELGANVTNPAFYRLISTTSDRITLPQTITYDAATKKATLEFAADIPAGTFKLEVGATDESNDRLLQAIHIGNSMATPYQAFLGDNFTLPAAQQRRDIDLYRFELRAPAAISVNLSPTASLDGAIRIFNASGAPIGSPTNAAGAGGAESVTTGVLAAGTYFVGISSAGNVAYDPVTGTGVTDGNSTGAYSFRATFSDLPALSDVNSSFATATPLGVLGLGGRVLQAAISPQPYNIQWPGAGDDPGHRDVPFESHIVTIPGLLPDPVNGIREITYDFQSVYGFTPTGQPLFNAISEAQKQRAREVLELYARYLGVQFREISSTAQNSFADLTIATGDPQAIAPTISTNLPAAGVRGIEGIPFLVPGAPLNPALNDPQVATTFTGAITGATTASPIVVTSAGHGRKTGEIVRVDGVFGNTAANGVWRVTVVDANNFALVGSNGSNDYTGGGQWTLLDITSRVAIVNALGSWGASEYGGDYFRTMMHEIGSFLGLGTSFDLPDLTIMGGQETPDLAPNTGEPVFPGDHDIVHGQALHRPESRDIDLYSFTVTEAGLFRAETIAERMNVAAPTLLNTVLTLYKEPGVAGQPRQLIARNDDYYGNDSYLELRLEPGTYYIAVTSTGNIEFDPAVADSGFGGRTQGIYDLKMELKPDSGSLLLDTTGVRFDGDADGQEGGKYEFWFQSNTGPNTTIYVDKANTTGPFLGTLADPLNNLAAAITAATTGPAKIIRVVGNGGADGDVNTLLDNRPYLVGFKDLDLILDEPLADGADFLVPQGVTVMIDAGANFKLRKANLNAGTTPQAILPSASGAIQVLGTPFVKVQFTSYHDDTIGGDSDGPQAGAQGGDWGGIVFRSDSDINHRLDREVQTLTLNGSGGTVTLSFDGVQGSAQTSFLNLSTTTAAQVQAHLESIPALARNVSVTGNPGGPFTITFLNALAGLNVSLLQAGLAASTPAVATDTVGGPGIVRVSEVQQLTLNNSGGTARLSFNGVLGTFESQFFDSNFTAAAQILLHLNTIPALNNNVAVTGNPGGPFLITFINALAGIDVSTLVGVGTPGNPNPLVFENIKGVTLNPILDEVQTLTLTNKGSLVTLTFNGVSGTAATSFRDLSSTTASDVLDHLNSIPALSGRVTVNGAPGGPFSITFVGAPLAGTDVSQLIATTIPSTGTIVSGGVTLSNEVQTLTLNNTGSNSLMEFNGVNGSVGTVFLDQPTTTRDHILANLNSIPALTGNVTVAGNMGGPFTITFINGLAGTNVNQLVALSLPVNLTVNTTTAGGAPTVPTNEIQSLSLAGTGASIILSFNGVNGSVATGLVDAATTTKEQVQAHLNSIPALNGNVTVTGAVGGPFSITFAGALAGTNVGQVQATTSGTVPVIAVAAEGDASTAFLNYVNNAVLTFGGGRVFVDSVEEIYAPIHLVGARPALSYNTVTRSADAALSADPNSFDDDGQRPDVAFDSRRIGPDVHDNTLVDNTINGLFVRIRSNAGDPIDRLDVTARFDDIDVVHVVAENLQISATPGGSVSPGSDRAVTTLSDARLRIDPGIIVKLSGSRIETQVGAQFIAEGSASLPIIFTSLKDDKYGGSGTFDTNRDGEGSVPAPGQWGGLVFGAASSANLDFVNIFYGGGRIPIEGGFDNFNALEIHQADVRIARSLLQFNAGGGSTSNRNGRGTNQDATIFIRGAQPVIVSNIIRDNAGPMISINANAMTDTTVSDLGRTTGPIDDFNPLNDNLAAGNKGPFVRFNRMVNNAINGMEVRGGTLTTETVWDDTDIAHILRDEIIVLNHHTFSGLRLQSAPGESLVVKLHGANAGFTAGGVPLDIDDRIGGTLHIVGQPGRPVVLTSIFDDTAPAGFQPNGLPIFDHNNDATGGGGTLPTGPEVNNGTLIDNDVATNDVGHFEVRPVAGGNIAQSGVTAQGKTLLFANQDFIFAFNNFVDVGPNGAAIDLATSTITLQPTLVSDDLVRSEGTFAGANGPVNWRVETRLDDGVGIVFNTITFNSATPLGDLKLVNYLDEDVLAFSDDLLYQVGTPGQPDFRLFTLDNAERIGFSQGGVYTPGPQLLNATYTGWAADKFADLVTVIAGAGTTYTVPGNIDTTDLPVLNDPDLGTVHGLADVTTAMAWTVDPAATTATITTFLELIARDPGTQGTAGDWRSIRLDKHSNDRNVSLQLESEGTTVGNADNNRTPQTAQLLGALAPNEKSGDDVNRLGFEIDGTIAYDRPNDVDVYSFTANSGTEVWIDIDRTSFGLDAVIELVDAAGNVLARATNTNPNAPSLPTPPPTIPPADPGLTGSALTFNKDHFNGRDTFTTNPWDPIMRVILPGVNLKSVPYFVRVRSQPTSFTGEAGNNVNPGLTSGHYQLQVRLRQQDEKPGSTVRYADIRFATNAIEVLGLPQHSPLLGEAAEADDAANNTQANSQFLGNLLTSDRNSISVGGDLSTATDVDWYSFTLHVDLIQVVNAYTSAGKSWATMFDIDYASGLARPDVTLAVYDDAGRLLLIGRDSDIADDQPGVGEPLNDADDLTRGSFGKTDPYIGSIQLPTSITGNPVPRRYHVAVMSNRQLPQVLDGTFNAGATVPGVRLEPIESVARVVGEHFDNPNVGTLTGGSTAEYPENTFVDPVLGLKNSTLINSTNQRSLQANVRPFTLADVTLYYSRFNRLLTIDPFTGVEETNVGALAPNNVGDIAMRSDGRLYSYQSPNGTDNVVANLQEVNPGNAAQTLVGPDAIPNTDVNNPSSQTDGGVTNSAIAFRPDRIDTVIQDRLYYAIPSRGADTFNVSPAPGVFPNGASRLYNARETDGVAFDPNNGFSRRGGTNNVIDGQIDATGETIFGTLDVRGTVHFRAVPQGVLGNGIIVNLSEGSLAPGALPAVAVVGGNVINIVLNTTTTQAAVTHDFNTGGTASFTFRAVAPGAAGNDIAVRITKRDRGIGVGPEILKVGNNILIELNTNAANPTTAGQLLTAFNNPGGPMSGFATATLAGPGATNIAAPAVGGTVLNFIGGTNRSSPAQVAQAVNANFFARQLVIATATGNVNGDATHGGQGGFAIPSVILTGGTEDLGIVGVARTADGPIGVTTGMAFSTDGLLYGVSDNGVFYRVSTTGSFSMALNAVAVNVNGFRPSFVAMAPAPVNVENGAYEGLLFALDSFGFLYAFNTSGVPQAIFDTNFDGLADSFQLQTQATAATGIAFSPLDFNMWHPSYRRQDDAGHSIGQSPSLVHANSFPDYLPGDGINDGINSSEGRTNLAFNQSFYFGFETRVPNPGPVSDSYMTYFGTDNLQPNLGQLGVISDDTQRYLSANGLLNNTYDMPGGAYGSLETDKFSLETLKSADKPTFYFDYFLNTQDRNSPIQGAQMRDSARVYVGPFIRNGVEEWDLLATNNSVLDNANTGGAGLFPPAPFFDGELPTFLSTSSTANPDNPRQHIQLIHDNQGQWRQARVDLSRYAGLSDLQLRFDFSTAGVMATPGIPGTPAGQGPALAPIPGEEFLYENLFGNFNSNQRGQENNFEGFFIDNIIVGPAERGEMVIGAPANTNLFSTPVPIQLDGTVPVPTENLVGPYQLEIRRGTEYAVSSGGTNPTITLITTLDTNERLIPDKRLQTAPIPLETFSTGTFNTLPWTAKGDVPWSVTSTGAAGDRRAVSGQITNAQSSDLEVSLITGEGNLTFSMDVSSEALYGIVPGSPPIFPSFLADANSLNLVNGDALRLYIDGRLATDINGNRAEWSGNTSISTVTIPVTAGRHTFRWSYEKDEAPKFDFSSFAVMSGLGQVSHDFGTTGVNTTTLTFKALTSRASGARINFTEADLGTFLVNGVPTSRPPVVTFSNPIAGPLVINITLNTNPTSSPTFAQELVDAINFSGAGAFIGAYLSSGNPFANITVGDPATYSPLIIQAVSDQAILDNISFPKPQVGVQDVYDDHTLHNTSLPGWPSAPTVPFPTTLPQFFFVNNLPSGFGRIGDQNVHREQGQILIEQNSIFAPAQSGIVVDAALQDTTAGGFTSLTHPGGVRNLPTLNIEQLAPGAVLVNNVIANFGQNGIRFSGALPNAQNQATASVPFGRIVNNTIYGGATANDTGIQVSERASPTILNNLISNTLDSITLDATSTSTVIGANLFHGNSRNLNQGTDSIVVLGTAPMFVDPANRNFYLVSGSRAVDSSVNSLQDRQQLKNLKSEVGIPESNILAPNRDVFGQLRVDDPSQDPPPGLGANIFKDRGAVERADFSRPTAQLFDPLDNDGANRDRDPDLTEVIIRNEILTRFVVKFLDVGTGIDDQTVLPSKFTLTSDGVPMVLGTDYTFVHNTNSDEVIFLPVSGQWPNNKTYVILVDNSAATGIRDLAGNPIQGNQTDGTVKFTIFVGTVRDFGDAPSPYPSLNAANGAAHDVTLGFHLGAGVSEEQDAKVTGGDDFDDGITSILLSPGNASSITVTASAAGFLDAWVDLNRDGDWSDPGENILSARPLTAGTETINVNLPSAPSLGQTWARFRLTSTGISSPIGVATDGEVEDYQVNLAGPLFHNSARPEDVDNDGDRDTIDLLVVLNTLTFLTGQLVVFSPSAPLPIVTEDAIPPGPYKSGTPQIDPTGGGVPGRGLFVDVVRDQFGNFGSVNTQDLLAVINWLTENFNPGGGGEGAAEGEGNGGSAASFAMAGAPRTAAGGSTLSTSGASSSGASGTSTSGAKASALLATESFYASPSILMEERSTESALDDTSWLQGGADDALNLVAAASPADGDAVGHLLSIDERARRRMPMGPLEEDAWDHLLTDLSLDVGGLSGDQEDPS